MRDCRVLKTNTPDRLRVCGIRLIGLWRSTGQGVREAGTWEPRRKASSLAANKWPAHDYGLRKLVKLAYEAHSTSDGEIISLYMPLHLLIPEFSALANDFHLFQRSNWLPHGCAPVVQGVEIAFPSMDAIATFYHNESGAVKITYLGTYIERTQKWGQIHSTICIIKRLLLSIL